MWTKEEDERLIELLFDESVDYTYKEISKLLGKNSPRASKFRAYALGLRKPHRPSKLIEIVKCTTCGEAFKARKKTKRKFCSRSCAVTYNNLKSPKRGVSPKPPCEICGAEIVTSGRRYCSTACSGVASSQAAFNRPTVGPVCVRNNLLRVRGNACEGCGLGEWKNPWYQGPIPLEVDHIDGDYKNNSLENLRLVCPTCHSTTETFKARNKGRGRSARMQRYRNSKSY